jgi:hypothetical protein
VGDTSASAASFLTEMRSSSIAASSNTGTSFYVQRPCDAYWNTEMSDYVVEAGPIDVTESGLRDWEKTDEYVLENLKVINPKNFSWPHIEKSMWVECSGPSRKLEFREYVELYHSLRPKYPLPKGWKKHN